MRKTAAQEFGGGGGTWWVYSFEKTNVMRLYLKESRDSFFWRGQERSFHVEGLKTEMAQEPSLERLVRGNFTNSKHSDDSHSNAKLKKLCYAS